MKLNPNRNEARDEIAIALQHLQVPVREMAIAPPDNWRYRIQPGMCFAVPNIGKFYILLARDWGCWITKIAPGLNEQDTLSLHSATKGYARAFGLIGRNSSTVNNIQMAFMGRCDECDEWHIDSLEGLQVFLEFLLNQGNS